MATATNTTDTAVLDEDLEAFGEAIFAASLGAAELTIVWLGRTLGLYAALRDGGALTAAELASTASVDERYTREWLEHQAIAQIVTVDDAGLPEAERRYTLPTAHAIALLDEEHPAYVGALAELPPIMARANHLVRDAFRTGVGVPFASYGLHDMQAGFSRPMFAHSLVDEWLPALPDVQARLEAGDPVRVADVGCGEGWAGIYLAAAYPNVTVDGFDLDDSSIAAARRHAAERGVDGRVRSEVLDIRDLDPTARYDLVFSCEVVHDLPDPVGALAAMRRAGEGVGAVLVVDERVAETFTPDGDPIERFMYAVSIFHCLPVGRDADTSAATGTVMRPDTFVRYATEAGFSSVEQLPIDHPFYRFYRPRP